MVHLVRLRETADVLDDVNEVLLNGDGVQGLQDAIRGKLAEDLVAGLELLGHEGGDGDHSQAAVVELTGLEGESRMVPVRSVEIQDRDAGGRMPTTQ